MGSTSARKFPARLRRLALPVTLAAALGIAIAVQSPPALPHPPTVSANPSLASFNESSYSPCSSYPQGPCLSYLNQGNYPTTATGYKSQSCDVSEFSGYPFGSNNNIGTDGRTLYDGWLFVTDPVNFYDIQVTFKDQQGNPHTWTFPSPETSPPTYQAQSEYAYYTKDYSHVVLLTPPGWTLTGGVGLLDRLRNKPNAFELSHTCPAGSQTDQFGPGDGECQYPPNPSVIYATVAGTDPYTVSGSLTENGCGEANQVLALTGAGYSSTTTTDSTGAFSATGVPGSAFPVTVSFAGNSSAGWPAANPVTVTLP